MRYLVHPNDVTFFRGNKSFDFGEWYSSGVFPPFPSTFQGFIRTAMLRKNGLINTDGTLTSHEEAIRLVGDDSGLPFEITGPYLIKNTGEAFLPMPLDAIFEGNKVKAASLGSTEIITDLGWKICMPQLSGKPRWAQDIYPFLTIEQFNKYCQNNEFPLIGPIQQPSCKELHTGIKLNYSPQAGMRGKTAEEKYFYLTEYQRLAEDVSFYFQTTSLTDIHNLYGKLGSEARGAWIEKTDLEMNLTRNDQFYADIASKGKFKIVLLQPGIFKDGWLPFAPKLDNGILLFEQDGLTMRLLYARTGKIEHIGGMSLRRMGKPEAATRGIGLKPMVNAVPRGATYYCEIIKSKGKIEEILKRWNGSKIPHEPFSSMGFNQIAVAQ